MASPTRTPAAFFDRLSRQHLTRRTLREFDRRTHFVDFPRRPRITGLKKHLTANLKRFARHGGPNLDNLRSYPENFVASRMPRKAKKERKRKIASKVQNQPENSASGFIKRSSAYDQAFQQCMIDNGYFPPGHNVDTRGELKRPENWNEIKDILVKARFSMYTSQLNVESFRKYQEQSRKAANERGVMAYAFPFIAGKPGKLDTRFNNLAEIAPDIQEEVVVDFYDGSSPSALRRALRDQFSEYIVPSTNTTRLILPNFFTEGKGPKGSMDVGGNQAFFDGTIGARAMHKLRSYAYPDQPLDENAYTITSMLISGQWGALLMLYSMHPIKSSDSSRQNDYHMTLLGSFIMNCDPESFRRGVIAFRNARDWAKKKREELIAAANERYDSQVSSKPIAAPARF